MKSNRRDALKKGLSLVAVASVASSVAMPAFARRRKKDGGGAEMVKPGEGMAAGVNYQHDKAKITDDKLKVEKQGVAFKDQHCKNCVLYTDKGDGKGACTLFPGKLVAADGWCTSWSKKG
tara:strand:+ start:14254 stop:14613 length:360 start_codon:yes stop_codon:yes gene_type:complete